jgi:hypothetical protein
VLLTLLSLLGPDADANAFPDDIELPDHESIVETAARELRHQAAWFVIEYRANDSPRRHRIFRWRSGSPCRRRGGCPISISARSSTISG